MSTAVATSIHDRRPPQPQPGGRLGAAQAVATVVGMELRQRLRSRGWYVLLGVFFVVVGAVTLGALGLRGLGVAEMEASGLEPVSYTHLTLPTILLV